MDGLLAIRLNDLEVTIIVLDDSNYDDKPISEKVTSTRTLKVVI